MIIMVILTISVIRIIVRMSRSSKERGGWPTVVFTLDTWENRTEQLRDPQLP